MTDTADVVEQWFLTLDERGNSATRMPIWLRGNRVRALVHGATYFDRLVDEVEALQPGDHLFFTDWRGDPDERMRDEGPTVAELFCDAAKRGVVVKGLVWRSHLDSCPLQRGREPPPRRGHRGAGGEVLLDQRVRRGGSHHQKLVVIRHPDSPERDVAFAGGIDLCHSRRDDADHAGDPQRLPMSAGVRRRDPPWHDVQLELRGPVVGALDTVVPGALGGSDATWTCTTRSPDPATSSLMRTCSAGPLPPQPPDPAGRAGRTRAGVAHVRRDPPTVRLRARWGNAAVARGYTKAIRRARRLIYLEDQYMWSKQVAMLFAEAMRANPELQLVVVVPRYPEVDGRFGEPPHYAAASRPSTCVEKQAATESISSISRT